MSYDGQLKPLTSEPTDPYHRMGKGWDNYIEMGILPSKMIQAVPWYGPVYSCSNFPLSNPNTPNPAKSCKTNIFSKKTQYHFGDLYKLIAEAEENGFERYYDEDYLQYNIIVNATNANDESQNINTHVAWFNTEETLRLRFERQALSSGAAGVASWWAHSLNYEDENVFEFNQKLWNQLGLVVDELL